MKEENIPDRVKNTRYKLRLSQKKFANLLDLASTTVYRWEAKKSKPPDGILHVLDIIDRGIEENGYNAVIKDLLHQEKLDCKSVIKYRFELRMSQETFAENLGVSINTVKRLEAGAVPQKYITIAIKDLVKKHNIKKFPELIILSPSRGKR